MALGQSMRTRFEKYMVYTGDCIVWGGGYYPNGYGMFSLKRGKPGLAHRVSYELFIGLIPPNLEIDHLCRNICCVNPAHLQAVTHQENVMRGNAPAALSRISSERFKRMKYCHRGHLYNEVNTRSVSRLYREKPVLGRCCRICEKDRHEKYRREQRYGTAIR